MIMEARRKRRGRAGAGARCWAAGWAVWENKIKRKVVGGAAVGAIIQGPMSEVTTLTLALRGAVSADVLCAENAIAAALIVGLSYGIMIPGNLWRDAYDILIQGSARSNTQW